MGTMWGRVEGSKREQVDMWCLLYGRLWGGWGKRGVEKGRTSGGEKKRAGSGGVGNVQLQ